MNNKLIPYKGNIFTKIASFFKKLFFRGKGNIIDENDEKLIYNNQSKDSFIKNIIIKENEEEKRLKNLQLKYDNGEIEEEEISNEDMEKLIKMYEKETEKLTNETEKIKKHIEEMLKEIKKT